MDSVRTQDKAAARDHVREALRTLDFGTKERGVRINAIASNHWLSALQFGLGDLVAELDLEPSEHRLAYFRTRIVLAAHSARVPALDTVFFDVRDGAGFRAEAREARMADFGADVIKVEHPAGDPMRKTGLQNNGVPWTVRPPVGTGRGKALSHSRLA